MSYIIQTTSLYLWCAQPVLESAVALVLWKRKLHKQFPVFFSFLLTQIAIFAATFPLFGRADMYLWYFWLYWIGEAVGAILGFKVIHEIFLDVFRPYHSLKDLGTPIFKWAGVVMLLVSVVVAASNSFGRDPVTQAVTTLDRSVYVVQVGLILFLVIFSRFLGVSRRQLSFGIALGCGSFAGAELLLLAMYTGKFIGHSRLDALNMLSFDLSLAIWLTYSIFAKAVREVSVNPLRTQRWEHSLAGLQHTSNSDSLIPMFEGMVERAFSRSSRLDVAEDVVGSSSAPHSANARSVAAGSQRRS
jgi:hypothetical protein